MECGSDRLSCELQWWWSRRELLQVVASRVVAGGASRWCVAMVASKCSSDSWVVVVHHIRLELGGVKLG